MKEASFRILHFRFQSYLLFVVILERLEGFFHREFPILSTSGTFLPISSLQPKKIKQNVRSDTLSLYSKIGLNVAAPLTLPFGIHSLVAK